MVKHSNHDSVIKIVPINLIYLNTTFAACCCVLQRDVVGAKEKKKTKKTSYYRICKIVYAL